MMLYYTKINYPEKPSPQDASHVRYYVTGRWEEPKLVKFLVIKNCKEDRSGCYLYSVSEEGDVIANTWHQNIKKAMQQTLFDFDNKIGDWEKTDLDIDTLAEKICNKYDTE